MPPITILYVEDDPLVLRTIKETLELEGWQVEPCADGLTALARLAGATHYDLLLLDHELPGASGLEIVRRARNLRHRQHVPVIILSAGDCAPAALRAGADEFLRKPDGVGCLIETIQRLLARGRGGVESIYV
jgi:CheY-like chemotaxis protein